MTYSNRLLTVPLAVLMLAGCDQSGNDATPVERELSALRAATAAYANFDAATAAGYTVRATDHWAGMGIHYLNPDLLDDVFEHERPEILMYVEQPDGRMEFVGVEYAVPVDLEDPAPAPEGFTGDADGWTINEQFGLWTLHAWVVLDNPDGVFAPHNPRVP
ncbi:MAG: hypothetical protein R3247_04265 [Rhodothermales bacterium]|nr:hypothetical protein [Rhodothermales bacterium]